MNDRGPSKEFRLLSALGLGCFAVALALSFAAERGRPFAGDVPIAQFVQGMSAPTLDALAWALTWIGRFWPMAVIGITIAVVFWRGRDRLGAGLVLVATLLYPLNALLKALVDRDRPTADVVTVLERAPGLGFPSGHAYGAMLLFGTVGGLLALPGRPRRSPRWLALAAILLAVAIGWSRVRLGAHWPSDVLGGWLWGGALASLLVGVAISRQDCGRPGRSHDSKSAEAVDPPETSAIQSHLRATRVRLREGFFDSPPGTPTRS